MLHVCNMHNVSSRVPVHCITIDMHIYTKESSDVKIFRILRDIVFFPYFEFKIESCAIVDL